MGGGGSTYPFHQYVREDAKIKSRFIFLHARYYSLFSKYLDGQSYSIQMISLWRREGGGGERKIKGPLAVYGTWYRRVSSPAMGSQGRLERLQSALLPDEQQA